MSVLVVGISHKTAPVSVLERVALDAEGAMKLVRDVSDIEHVTEAAAELGVSQPALSRALARFEAHRSEGHHHHMVCDACGVVIPFEDAELEKSIQRLARKVTFTVAEHDVVLHGSCAECSA